MQKQKRHLFDEENGGDLINLSTLVLCLSPNYVNFGIMTIKKVVFLGLFLIFTQICKSQDYNRSFGAFVNAGVATVSSPGLISPFDFVRPSISAGLNFKQRLFKSPFFVEAGLQVMDRGTRFNMDIVDINGNIIGSSFKKNDFYIDIPWSLSFKVKNFHLGFGFNAGYFVVQRSFIDNRLVESGRPSYVEPILYSSHFFAGKEFIIDDYIFFFADLRLNRAIDFNYRNMGFLMGLRKKIN